MKTLRWMLSITLVVAVPWGLASGLTSGGAPNEGSPPASPHTDPTLASAALAAPSPDDPRLADPASELARRYFDYTDAYYRAVDHTRIHVTRPRGPGESPPRAIRAASPTLGEGRPGRPYADTLRVAAEPGVPVTFFAPDHGLFANGQRAITVKADEQGVAVVVFTFAPLAGAYRIVAASPETHGVVLFRLQALTDDEARERLALTGGR